MGEGHHDRRREGGAVRRRLSHRFSVLRGRYAIARISRRASVPEWADAARGAFHSITRTLDELSVVCAETAVPKSVHAERGWKAIKLLGPFSFDQVGVLASVANPLAASGVSIFAVSTFKTDYILVKDDQLGRAVSALKGAGHRRIMERSS